MSAILSMIFLDDSPPIACKKKQSKSQIYTDFKLYGNNINICHLNLYVD